MISMEELLRQQLMTRTNSSTIRAITNMEATRIISNKITITKHSTISRIMISRTTQQIPVSTHSLRQLMMLRI